MENLTTMMYVFLGIDIFSIAVLLLMKKVGSNKFVYNSIGVYMFVVCILLFMATPTEKFVLKVLSGVLFIPGIVATMNREKNFELGRILMIVTIVLGTAGLFLLG